MRNRKDIIVGLITLIVVIALGTTGLALRIRKLNSAREKEQAPPVAADSRVRAGRTFVGDIIPDLGLETLDGYRMRLADVYDGEHFVVVTFHHPDCPCAANCGRLISEMGKEGYDDVRVVGILSAGEGDERVMKALAQQREEGIVTFPMFLDRDGEIRKLLGATRTPEMWVTDKSGRIVFYGAPENTLFPGSPGHRYLLREAIDAMRKGTTPEIQSFEPIGCPIDGV